MMAVMQVEAVKLFVLKTINLATLVYQLFVIQTNANSAQKYLHLSNYSDYLSVSLQTFLHTIRCQKSRASVHTASQSLVQPDAICKERKEQLLLFSNHNGSLSRWQPRAASPSVGVQCCAYCAATHQAAWQGTLLCLVQDQLSLDTTVTVHCLIADMQPQPGYSGC